jgi:hypothetical protein
MTHASAIATAHAVEPPVPQVLAAEGTARQGRLFPASQFPSPMNPSDDSTPLRLECGPCVLRPWRRGDEAALVRYANNRESWRNLRDQAVYVRLRPEGTTVPVLETPHSASRG